MKISIISKIVIVLLFIIPKMVYASCVDPSVPCNDTNSNSQIDPAVIIIPLVIVGAGVWYWLSESDKSQQRTFNLQSINDTYVPYSFALTQLPNNELGRMQLTFTYEF